MSSDSTSNNSETDWARLDTMSDQDIDLSDCPEVTPDMFSRAVVRRAPGQKSTPSGAEKSMVTVTIDRDVLEWFESLGDQAERQMALALKIYAEANKAYSGS